MLRSPTCPNCCRNFGTQDPTRPHGPRMPVLLKCGHTFCEGCLAKLGKSKTSLPCPKCQVLTPLGEHGIKELWPDVYVLGLLSLNRKLMLEGNVFMKLSQLEDGKARRRKKRAKKIDVTATEDPISTEELCDECGKKAANSHCVKCESNMCGLCFDKVHKASKILKKHQAIPLHMNASVAAFCSVHANRTLDLYCNDDDIPICTNCAIWGEHRTHRIVSMDEKNREIAADIEPAVQVARETIDKLKSADRMLSESIPEVKHNISHMTQEIRLHFRILHALLQVREQVLIENLEEAGVNKTEPLEDMKDSISINLKKLSLLIDDVQKAKKTGSELVLNAKELVAQLSTSKDIPCNVVTNENADQPDFQFKVDKTIVDTIIELGQVESSITPRYTLKSCNELPADWSPPPFPSRKFLSPPYEKTEEVNSGAGVSQARSELVHVTHIRTPCHFKVQRCSDSERYDAMKRAINKHCCDKKAESVDEAEVGDIYGCQFSHDKMWYRARIRTVLENETDEERVEVLYVDYGNIEIVPLSRLRKLKSKHLHVPELAMTCSLVDIVSAAKNGEWSTEAVHTFATMVGKKPIFMTVLNHASGMLYVDLHKPPSDDIDDDVPVSVRDALVFLEVAQFESSASCPLPGMPVVTPPRKFINPSMPKKAEFVDLTVSHIVNAGDFYIQKVGPEVQHLTQLTQEMQVTFNKERGDVWQILCPKEDMICAAKYDVDDTWYRAVVIGLPGNRKVKVKYVDFGNTEVVDYTKLQKIPDDFCRLPVQAIRCSMADIAPKADGWTDADSHKLQQLVQFKPLVALVQEVVDNVPCVLLYDTSSDVDVCINAVLVSEGIAVSTGPGSDSSKAMVKAAPKADKEKEGKDDCVAVGPVGAAQKHPAKYKPKIKPPDDVSYTEVLVSHIESPFCIYVQLATAEEDGLDDLMKSMTSYYNKHPCDDEEIEWTDGAVCAALYVQGEVWCRAKIVTLLPGNLCVVIYTDFGNSEVVALANLRKLNEEFRTPSPFAICCYLAGIQPAGGKHWTKTACEFLVALICGVECFLINKESEAGKNSSVLPIDLLYEIPEDETANSDEPATPILISAAKTLILQGVALPSKMIPSQGFSPDNITGIGIIGKRLEDKMNEKSVMKAKAVSLIKAEYGSDQTPIDAAESDVTESDDATDGIFDDADSDTERLMYDLSDESSGTVVTGSVTLCDDQTIVGSEDTPAEDGITGGNEEMPSLSSGVCEGKNDEFVPVVEKNINPTTTVIKEIDGVPHDGAGDRKETILATEKDGKPATGITITHDGGGDRRDITNTVSSSCSGRAIGPIIKIDGKVWSGSDNVVPDGGGDRVMNPVGGQDDGIRHGTPTVATGAGAGHKHGNHVLKADVGMGHSMNTPSPDFSGDAGRVRGLVKTQDSTARPGTPTLVQRADRDQLSPVLKTKEGMRRRMGSLTPENGSCGDKIAPPVDKPDGNKRPIGEASSSDGGCNVVSIPLLKPAGGIHHGSTATRQKQSVSDDTFANPLKKSDGGVSCSFPESMLKTRHLNRTITTDSRPDVKVLSNATTTVQTSHTGDNTCSPHETNSGHGLTSTVGHMSGIHQKVLYKPPVLPTSDVISFSVTYVDSDCMIYGHEIKEGNETLMRVMDNLQVKFEGSKPLPNDYDWRLGQACSAKFKDDEQWYRAKILDITDTGIEVIYIDFGNTEIVDRSHLRDEVVDIDIPQHCLECVLHGITPNSGSGKWCKEAIYFLTETLLGNIVTVYIKAPAVIRKPLQVDVKVENFTSLSEVLVHQGWARCFSDSLVIKDVNANPMKSVYKQPQLPSPGVFFPVIVTHINNPGNVYIQRLGPQANSDDSAQGAVGELEELERISSEMNKHADDFEMIENPVPGMACCSQYIYDDEWYRSEILKVKSLSPLTVEVGYVDYGTKETIPVDRLRKLPEEFKHLPVQAVKCELVGLKPPSCVPSDVKLVQGTAWPEGSLHALTNVVMDQRLTACIKESDSKVKLLLFTSVPTDKGVPLVFKSLVEQGLAELDSDAVEQCMVELSKLQQTSH
ncbi:RING finger protein 17-like isoform X2 [Ptychodera flava]|uniref:RING finger protein 17-like isoform X2 n=1 Tax=Ptychodera flava TaxID=63121 RepID=UPI00396A888A